MPFSSSTQWRADSANGLLRMGSSLTTPGTAPLWHFFPPCRTGMFHGTPTTDVPRLAHQRWNDLLSGSDAALLLLNKATGHALRGCGTISP